MRNVLVLTLAQFFGAFGQVTMVLLAGIIGAMLTPDPRLATLPVTCAVIGVALATLPASIAMQRFGRRRVFMAGALWSSTGALLAALSLIRASFGLYCLASFMIGSQLAFTAHYRFAAAESVAPGRVSRVVATVMLGTLAAALIAPWLVIRVRLWTSTEYVSSFLVLAVIYVAGFATLRALREPPPTDAAATGEARSLALIARQPVFILAVAGSAVGYGVMAMIMTATPLSMHVVDGHSVEDTALVIQSHVLGMYAPSLVSGWLVARLGALRMMAAGVASEALCIGLALSGHGVVSYWGALTALGVGWNLLFVAGTTLLTTTYRPAERFRVQGLNDLLMFGITAIVSLLAGVLMTTLGWGALNRLALLPLAVMIISVFWVARAGLARPSEPARP